jgi:hypothetical protein
MVKPNTGMPPDQKSKQLRSKPITVQTLDTLLPMAICPISVPVLTIQHSSIRLKFLSSSTDSSSAKRAPESGS